MKKIVEKVLMKVVAKPILAAQIIVYGSIVLAVQGLVVLVLMVRG